MESKKYNKLVNTTKNRLTGIENKPVATRGEEVGEGKAEKGDEREQPAGHKINKR